MTSEIWDEIMDAVADEERRRLLLTLRETSPREASPLTPEDRNLSTEECERHRIALHHNHLPKLEDAGFISWEKDEKEVRKGPNFDCLEPVFHTLDKYQDTSPREHPAR